MISRKSLDTKLVKGKGAVLLGLMLLAWVCTSNAGVIFDRPPLNGGDASQSNWTGGSQYADVFSFNRESTIESVQWRGSYLSEGNDDFSVRVFSDSGGPQIAPLFAYTSLSVIRTPTPMLDSSGSGIFSYELALPTNLTLPAGTYYLSVLNNEDVSSTNNNNPSDWLWLQSTVGDGNIWFRQLDGDIWSSITIQNFNGFSYSLTGTQKNQSITEPSSLTLFVLGAVLMHGRKLMDTTRRLCKPCRRIS